MLKLRPEQIHLFDLDTARRFESEMVEHGKAFSPRLSQVLGDEQLRVAVRRTIERAKAFGFTNRGPIRLCVELMFLCGSGFDSDPQYPEIGDILRESGEQMWRAERIVARVNDYQDNVSGKDNINVRKALEHIASFSKQAGTFTANGLAQELLTEMYQAFPQKATYLGRPALKAVIVEGRAAAKRYRLTTLRAEALIVILMYAFGHGCIDDPLYPWISQTLNDPKIVDATTRGERLERKALTWLDHVLARQSPEPAV